MIVLLIGRSTSSIDNRSVLRYYLPHIIYNRNNENHRNLWFGSMWYR